MDDNTRELTALLYTRIGMMMEDASVIALELGGPGNEHKPTKVQELRRSVHAIVALLAAAQAVQQ